MPNPEIAFYADPKVWSAIIAGAALVLSQFPPIISMLRKGKLELDVYEKAHITHALGNPNIQFHLIINNVGGKSVTVESIKTELTFDSDQPKTIKAQSYLKNVESNSQVLLTKIKIGSGEEWAHATNFYNDFNKAEEKESKSFTKKARDEFTKKLKDKRPDQEKVEINEPLVSDIMKFFEKKFIWVAGEYTCKISISCSDKTQNISKTFRFTLFESDSDELREYSNKYKFGESFLFSSNVDLGILINLKELNS